MHSEFEPAIGQITQPLHGGFFVVDTGKFYPDKPLSAEVKRTIDLTEHVIVSDFSFEKMKRISYKIDVIMATIALALIQYKDN